jgi:hypothetical protein
MIARAAFSMCVSGNRSPATCTARGAPSSEKNTPDSTIIGHDTMLSTPPANSSLLTRAATIRPMAIMLIAASTVTMNRSTYEPSMRKCRISVVPMKQATVMVSVSASRDASCAVRNSSGVSGVAFRRLR